jgi:tol-pal system protein YbgF
MRVNGLERSINKNISRELDTRLKSVRENQAETGAELDEIRIEIQELSGRAEENRRLIKQAIEMDSTDQDLMRVKMANLGERIRRLETAINQIQGYLGLEPPPGPAPEPMKQDTTGTSKGQEAVPQARQVPGTAKKEVSPEQELYDFTLASYKDGKYEAALAGFEGFISKFSESKLADNAQFWIGECYMSMGRYEKAILAYQEVIKKYPSGNKVPNALLRQALAFYKIGDKTSSKLLLRKIIKKYPDSNEANIAKIRLEKMK